ncbi:MAG: YbhB/YbcL family Raf kinase inhibitor-like protein [SAR86 cluster bacterium]|uniref:YbhB/YbcL family Raf kinase inhibitor-like protein n=1 Tax=SAR86 cluster bacterium TaxID=2030880 RepID=A0A2A5ACT0_9GAMM|nr:MAG: YbhB/YbcL family Raf kinase inhibitor-like protein [SAR86 cluster bacterium]
MKSKLNSIVFALLAVIATGASQVSAQGFQLPNMQVTSNAFPDGSIIPIKYTSHGDNIQPNFTITGAPDETVGYAIIFHDIEVALGGGTGDVTHWIAWDIPSANIPEGSLPEGSVEGNNIAGQASFMGSGAPFADRFHHYVFEFYALSEKIGLPEGSSRDELEAALQGKVIAKAAYVGRYANAQ